MALEQLKLRRVCASCNNEWMSRIENLVKPVLSELIRGQPRVINPPEHRLVAMWCQLKCITIDALYGGHYEGIRHLPPEVAHTFCQRGQPLLNSVVRLGRFEPPKAGVMMRWGRHMGNVATSHEHPPMNLVTVTMAIGFLVTQAVVGAWMPDNPSLKAEFPAPPDWALPCWPLDSTVSYTWPPRLSITPETFDDLASTGTNTHRFLPNPR